MQRTVLGRLAVGAQRRALRAVRARLSRDWLPASLCPVGRSKLHPLVGGGSPRPSQPVPHLPTRRAPVGQHLVVGDGGDAELSLHLSHARLAEDVLRVHWRDGLGQALVVHVVVVDAHRSGALDGRAPQRLVSLWSPQIAVATVAHLWPSEGVEPPPPPSETHARARPQRGARDSQSLVENEREVCLKDARTTDVLSKILPPEEERPLQLVRGAHHVLDHMKASNLPQCSPRLSDQRGVRRLPPHTRRGV